MEQIRLGQSLQETASQGRVFVQAPKPEGTELRTSFYVLKASLFMFESQDYFDSQAATILHQTAYPCMLGSRCVLTC